MTCLDGTFATTPWPEPKPAVRTVSVLSIAIGVGATTAVVTLANTLLLRPPPGVGHPDRVVPIGHAYEGRSIDNFSYPSLLDYRAGKSLSVAQRTREIGVRVALGAPRRHVLALIVRQGVILAGVGVMVGSLAAFGVTRLIRDLLYGVPPTDVVAFSAAAATLAVAALAASWIPARRVTGVDRSSRSGVNDHLTADL